MTEELGTENCRLEADGAGVLGRLFSQGVAADESRPCWARLAVELFHVDRAVAVVLLGTRPAVKSGSDLCDEMAGLRSVEAT